MASLVDPTKPADDALALKSELRANLQQIKDEIEDLQVIDENVLQALGLNAGDTDFPPLGGVFTPSTSESMTAIILALDAAINNIQITGGGATQLNQLSDILSPAADIRRAFGNPVEVATQTNSFTFNEASMAGSFITVDNSGAERVVTFPDPATLTRQDGYLCTISPASGANPVSITTVADGLRFQSGIAGSGVVQTTVFIGYSTTLGIRANMDVFLDGGVYILRGQGRFAANDNIGINSFGSIVGTAIETGGIGASQLATSLDLGGSALSGGAREFVINVTGNRPIAQTDAGKILEHTGGAAAVWDLPALAVGTTVQIENATGGDITFNDTGSQTLIGDGTIQTQGQGAVRWLQNSVVRITGAV